MTEQNNNPGQSPYGAYGAPQQPPVAPQQAQNPSPAPQGQSPYSAPPQPQGQPQNQAPYNNPYQQNGGYFPAAQKPLVVETAYAFLYFLGIFGGHKFYLRQTMQGVAYLGTWLAVVILGNLPVIGSLIFLAGIVALGVSIYADIRTMKEQVERSTAGETFAVLPTQMAFIKKAFNRS